MWCITYNSVVDDPRFPSLMVMISTTSAGFINREWLLPRWFLAWPEDASWDRMTRNLLRLSYGVTGYWDIQLGRNSKCANHLRKCVRWLGFFRYSNPMSLLSSQSIWRFHLGVMSRSVFRELRRWGDVGLGEGSAPERLGRWWVITIQRNHICEQNWPWVSCSCGLCDLKENVGINYHHYPN